MEKENTLKILDNPKGKYFTLKEALDFLESKGRKRSLGWLRIEILKKSIRSYKFYNSRVVLKEDLIKLSESL